MGETMVPANGVDLCLEAFGRRDDPAVLLIAGGARSMDWWEDGFCRRLADGGRFVIRYDHRDTGRSTSFPAGAPPYSQVDMAEDALGVLDALGVARAHIVGLSLGGGLAQRLAVEDPPRLRTLTLISTTPGLIDESPAGTVPPRPPRTDWSDRAAAVDELVACVAAVGGPFTADTTHLRQLAERVFDRTTDPAAAYSNHWLAACGPPVRDRLGTVGVPTLVMHGTVDPLLSMAHPAALAREIPDARLVPLPGVGHEFPPQAVWGVVIEEILRHTA
ncbi:alpha/beta hydrolase [Actinoplanes sp. NPDC048791]|uniref:alpha/beta fold hydrolase n=1 Tax=Actinoplanes sp. NPDC048791 TaxID=3154623 RepID=UPI003408A8E7